MQIPGLPFLPRTGKELAYLAIAILIASLSKVDVFKLWLRKLKARTESQESNARASKLEAEADEIRVHSSLELIDRLDQSQKIIAELREKLIQLRADFDRSKRALATSQGRERIYELELQKSETGRKFLEHFMMVVSVDKTVDG
jgi:hypothetical protein